MGADRGQPEPPSWLPPDDTNPEARAPEREWYPGMDWYPGQEYQPPQYGDSRYSERRYGQTRHRGSPHLPAGEFSSRAQEYRELGRRDEYPPGGHSILGLNPPQRHRPGRRHQIRNGMLIGLGFLIVIVGIGTGLTGEKFPASSSRSQAGAGTSAAAGSAGPAGSAAARTKSGAGSGPRAVLTYRVTGTPGGRVTYGPAGTYLTGRAPMRVTARLGDPLYYFITAQLAGRGSVQCEILIGTRVMDKSVATGRRNLASCEISRDPLTGKWQDPDGS